MSFSRVYTVYLMYFSYFHLGRGTGQSTERGGSTAGETGGRHTTSPGMRPAGGGRF